MEDVRYRESVTHSSSQKLTENTCHWEWEWMSHCEALAVSPYRHWPLASLCVFLRLFEQRLSIRQTHTVTVTQFLSAIGHFSGGHFLTFLFSRPSLGWHDIVKWWDRQSITTYWSLCRQVISSSYTLFALCRYPKNGSLKQQNSNGRQQEWNTFPMARNKDKSCEYMEMCNTRGHRVSWQSTHKKEGQVGHIADRQRWSLWSPVLVDMSQRWVHFEDRRRKEELKGA